MKKILISMVIITIGIGGMLSMSRSANAAIIDYTETTTETSTVAANEDTSVQNGKSESTESQTTENDTLNRIIDSVNEGDAINPDGTIKEMDAENLFHKIHVKTFEGMTALQKEMLIITFGLFVIALIGIVWAAIFNKKKIAPFVGAALIVLIVFVCIFYAPEIMLKFKQWFID